jgi:hypothetical protein
MSKVRVMFFVGIILLCIIAGVVGGSLAWNLWSVWRSSDLEAFRAIAGGFSGAFFAYLFVRFGESMKILYDRQRANGDALVRLEHYFNVCLEILNTNEKTIDKMQIVFSDARLRSSRIPIFGVGFRLFQINREIPLSLTNIDYINDICDFNADLELINLDLTSIQQGLQEVRDAFLAKAMEEADYNDNAKLFRESSSQLLPFLARCRIQIIRLIAISRILQSRKSFWSKLAEKVVRTSYPDDLPGRLASVELNVKREIDRCSIESQESTRRIASR